MFVLGGDWPSEHGVVYSCLAGLAGANWTCMSHAEKIGEGRLHPAYTLGVKLSRGDVRNDMSSLAVESPNSGSFVIAE